MKTIALIYAGASSMLDGAKRDATAALRPVMEWAKAIDPDKIKTSRDLAHAATDEARLLSSGPTAKVAPALGRATATGAAESIEADIISVGSRVVGGAVGAAAAVVTFIATPVTMGDGTVHPPSQTPKKDP